MDTLRFVGDALLSGMLHSAGVLRDKLLRFMMADDMDTACAAKARGASLIQVGVRGTPLEVLGLCRGFALALQWLCTGLALASHWICSGVALA